MKETVKINCPFNLVSKVRKFSLPRRKAFNNHTEKLISHCQNWDKFWQISVMTYISKCVLDGDKVSSWIEVISLLSSASHGQVKVMFPFQLSIFYFCGYKFSRYGHLCSWSSMTFQWNLITNGNKYNKCNFYWVTKNSQFCGNRVRKWRTQTYWHQYRWWISKIDILWATVAEQIKRKEEGHTDHVQ